MTAFQIMNVIGASSLFGRAIKLVNAAQAIGQLDLKTPAVIGSATRQGVIEVLDEIEHVRDHARLAVAFRPPAELADVPSLISRVAARGAAVVAACVYAVSAETLAEAQKLGQRLPKDWRTSTLTPSPDRTVAAQ